MIELMEYIKPTNLSGLLLRFLLKIKNMKNKKFLRKITNFAKNLTRSVLNFLILILFF